MQLSLLIQFIGASILLSIMPGPDNIYVLSESLSRGSKAGILISIGLACGLLIHTTLAATGLSLLIYRSPLAYKLLTYLGATYLLYLAFMSSKEQGIEIKRSKINETSNSKATTYILKGFLLNISNPKVSLFFIAFLPRFIDIEENNFQWQMVILGIVFITQALIIFSGIALLAGKFSKQLNKENFWKYTKWSKVTILAILGISMLLN